MVSILRGRQGCPDKEQKSGTENLFKSVKYRPIFSGHISLSRKDLVFLSLTNQMGDTFYYNTKKRAPDLTGNPPQKHKNPKGKNPSTKEYSAPGDNLQNRRQSLRR
jgi:hypothetical protein